MSPPAPRRLRHRLLLAVASTLLCLATVEIGVRLGWDNLPDGIYPDDTGCCAGGTLLPDVVGHDRFHAFRHNSRGYRGPEYGAPHAPEGGLRVAVVGDSFVYGVGVSEAEALPGRLGDRLGAEVINAGVPGGDLETGLLRAEAVVRDYRPDVVLLVLLFNDLETFGTAAPPLNVARVTTERETTWLGRLGDWMVPPLDPGQGRNRRVSASVERRYALARAWRTWLYAGLELQRVGTAWKPLERELTLLHLDSAQIDAVAWERTRAQLERFRAMAEREGVRAGIVFFQYGPLEGVPALKLHAITRASGLPVLDLDPLWGGYDAFVRDWSFRYDLHPNRAANRAAADTIAAWMGSLGWVPGDAAWAETWAAREAAWLDGQRVLAEEQRARLATVQAGFRDTLVGAPDPRQANQWLYGWWPGTREGARMGERGGFLLRAGPNGASRLTVEGARIEGARVDATPLTLSATCAGETLGTVAPDATFAVDFALTAAPGAVVECELAASGVVTPPTRPGAPRAEPASFVVSRVALR